MSLKKNNNHNSLVFAVCLLSPILAGVLRKTLPGQPVYADALPALLPLLIGVNTLLSKNKVKMKRQIIGPLFGWALFQTIFAIFAIQNEILVGISAIFTRICPMFMTIIAFNSIKKENDLQTVSYLASILILIMLPFGLYSSIYGNSALPTFFRPIDIITIAKRDEREGLSSFAGLFSSQWILSISCLSILYLLLTQFFLGKKSAKETIWWAIAAASTLALIYFSTRRGAFLMGLFGLAFVLFKTIDLKKQKGKRSRSNLIIGIVVVMSIMYFLANNIDKYAVKENDGKNKISRSSWVLSKKETSMYDRLERVFIPITIEWAGYTPFGKYLGYGGPEVRAFKILGYREYTDYVEVGSAQLVAEMGIAGTIIMPLLIILVIVRVYRLSRKSKYEKAISLLLLYMIIVFSLYYTKESLVLVNVSVCSLFFWSVPGICAALLKFEKIELKNN